MTLKGEARVCCSQGKSLRTHFCVRSYFGGRGQDWAKRPPPHLIVQHFFCRFTSSNLPLSALEIPHHHLASLADPAAWIIDEAPEDRLFVFLFFFFPLLFPPF